MQAGETLMGFPGGRGRRASPLEAHQRQQQLSLGAQASGDVTIAEATATTISTCHRALSSPSSYDNNNNNNTTSQQLIYSVAAANQQQVGAPTASNFQQHATPPPPVTTRHHSHHNTSNNESYLHLHQGANHLHHHSNLVRKHQYKHQSHTSSSSSSSGVAKAKQQIAEYAVQRAAAVTASQQSLLATTTTTTTTTTTSCGSPLMLSSPEAGPVAGEGGVVSPIPRARVGSISNSYRYATPTSSYSPRPQSAAQARSLSFSSASASDALLAARGQLQPTSSSGGGGGELCFSSDTSASYQLAMAGGDPYAPAAGYQTPTLLSLSTCSSVGSPPASLLTSQQSPSPTPPPVSHHLSANNSILYNNTNNIVQQQQQQYHHHTAPIYQGQQQQQQYVPQLGHGGGGNSSAPSGGSSTISTSDSLNMSINLEQYISKRNERERSRVRNVNDAFDNLKNSLPLETEKISKRMSKVEILRTAIGYIRELERTLNGPTVADHKPRAPSGGHRNRHGSFGASGQGPMAGENRGGGNFAGSAHELLLQHQRQPFQPDLNHDNRYSYQQSSQPILHYNNNNNNSGFRDNAEPVAKSEGYDCRHDQQQQQQQQLMMNFEEY